MSEAHYAGLLLIRYVKMCGRAVGGRSERVSEDSCDLSRWRSFVVCIRSLLCLLEYDLFFF